MNNITSKFCEAMENKGTKQAKKVIQYLNQDKLTIWTDDYVVYIEHTDDIPSYVRKELLKFVKELGLKFWYE